MSRSGIGEGKAIIDSEPEESLDDEDEDDTTDDAPSIDLVEGCGRTTALWIGPETGDGATLTFAYFPFDAYDGSVMVFLFHFWS
jgi:hypothetical protein